MQLKFEGRNHRSEPKTTTRRRKLAAGGGWGRGTAPGARRGRSGRREPSSCPCPCLCRCSWPPSSSPPGDPYLPCPPSPPETLAWSERSNSVVRSEGEAGREGLLWGRENVSCSVRGQRALNARSTGNFLASSLKPLGGGRAGGMERALHVFAAARA